MSVPTGLAGKALLVSGAAGVLYFGTLLLSSLNALPMLAIHAHVLEVGLITAGLPMAALQGFVIWRLAHQVGADLGGRDDLTGLQTRRAFTERATRALDCARVGSVAIVLFDVEGLKRLNDTCGHRAGDEMVRTAGQALRRTAGKAVNVYRLGGDEFGLVLSRSRGARLSSLARAVRPFDADFRSCGHRHHVSLSMGFASCTDAEGFDALFRRTRVRLEEARERQHAARAAARTRPVVKLATRDAVDLDQTEAQPVRLALA